jgi:hypothetical protein
LVRLFDRLRDPIFEPGHPRFEPVEARVDLIETPQPPRFKSGDVIANVEDLAFDVLESKFDGLEPKLELARHSVESFGHRLMKRGKATRRFPECCGCDAAVAMRHPNACSA